MNDRQALFALFYCKGRSIELLIATLIHWGKEEDWWDWESEEMPVVFGRLGTRTLPALAQVMANTKHSERARQDAVQSVEAIFKKHPDSRETCVQILMTQLEQFTKNDSDLNAYLVTTLVTDMKAIEAAELIEQAFQVGRVNEDFIGDWDDAPVYLGLKEASELPQRYRNIITNPWEHTSSESMGFTVGKGKVPKTQAKAKRKLQSQSRKKNRTKRK